MKRYDTSTPHVTLRQIASYQQSNDLKLSISTKMSTLLFLNFNSMPLLNTDLCATEFFIQAEHASFLQMYGFNTVHTHVYKPIDSKVLPLVSSPKMMITNATAKSTKVNIRKI